MYEELRKKSRAELEKIAIEGVNAEISTSQANQARRLLEIMGQKESLESQRLEQKELIDNQRIESRKLIHTNWALVFVTLIIGIVSILVTLYISQIQINNDSKKESATLMFQLSDEFRNSENSSIVYAIAIGQKPLLIANGGKFTDEQLDNYLIRYELLYNAYQDGLISYDDLDTAFGYDVGAANQNLEVQKFISDVRKESNDSRIYRGFSTLAQILK